MLLSQTHRHFHTWSNGIDWGAALSKLSPCFESCGVVKFGSQSSASDDVSNHFCTLWTADHWDG